jgi:hypothetical protein
MISYRVFTLAKFVSKTVGDSNMRQSLLYLLWSHWAARHKIEMTLSVSCCLKWPRQVRKAISHRNIAGVMPFKFGNGNMALGIINIYTLIIFNLRLCLSINGGFKASSHLKKTITFPPWTCVVIITVSSMKTVSCNRTVWFIHQCRKTTLLSCHRCLRKTGVEKMNNI